MEIRCFFLCFGVEFVFRRYFFVGNYDSFRKIVVVRDNIEPWQDDNGIQYIGVEQII